MNNEIKTTKLVIDKQPKLDVDELINRYNESQERINKAIEYIENEMPYLQEIDKEYEDVNGNTYFTYKEYDGKELLKILKGE